MLDISRLRKNLGRLKSKNPSLFKAVQKKINQIAFCDEISIEHFKNLKGNISGLKRVHIGSFVLTFQVKNGMVIFYNFDHHDRIYNK